MQRKLKFVAGAAAIGLSFVLVSATHAEAASKRLAKPSTTRFHADMKGYNNSSTGKAGVVIGNATTWNVTAKMDNLPAGSYNLAVSVATNGGMRPYLKVCSFTSNGTTSSGCGSAVIVPADAIITNSSVNIDSKAAAGLVAQGKLVADRVPARPVAGPKTPAGKSVALINASCASKVANSGVRIEVTNHVPSTRYTVYSNNQIVGRFSPNAGAGAIKHYTFTDMEIAANKGSTVKVTNNKGEVLGTAKVTNDCWLGTPPSGQTAAGKKRLK